MISMSMENIIHFKNSLGAQLEAQKDKHTYLFVTFTNSRHTQDVENEDRPLT